MQALYVWCSSFTKPASPNALFVPAGVLRPVGGKLVVELAVGDVITLIT